MNRKPDCTRKDRRWGGLAGVAAIAAVALAACSGPSSPSVASLGTHDGSAGGRAHTTTTLSGGDPTRLLNEWAACMRSHGDADQADPTIDANRDIDVTWNPAVPGGIYGTNKGGQGDAGPGQYCRSYLNAAQTALGGQRQQSQSQAQITLEKYSECMRANGITDFPDPTNGTLSINVGAGGDLSPNNPTYQSASRLCAQRTGAQVPGAGGPPPPGIIRINGESPPGSDG